MYQDSALGITQIPEEAVRSQGVYFLSSSLINCKIRVLIEFIFSVLGYTINTTENLRHRQKYEVENQYLTTRKSKS